MGFDDLIVEQPEGLLVLGQLTESVDQNVIAEGIDRDRKLVCGVITESVAKASWLGREVASNAILDGSGAGV